MVASVGAGHPRLLRGAERSRWTLLQKVPCIDRAEVLDQRSDQSGPAGLVDGSESRAVVAVEVLVKQQIVAPVGIGLKRFLTAVDGPAPVRAALPDRREPPCNFARDFVEVHQRA